MTAVEQTFSTTHCAFGVARRDVTPPVGIYARSWGAATHDVAEGVHRPLTATAAVFAPLAGDGPTLALVALDIGWFPYAPDELALRAAIMERTGLGEAELLVQMSHTHAGANTNSRLEGRPGTELIAPYLEHLTAQVGDAVAGGAQSTATEAFVTYGHGRCGLAANRDFWDAEAERYACGYNPDGTADDTLLVARATDGTGRTLATLFNYACHPTTLAWENRLLSPDYVGAAREVLEQAFGAPALFLQGASGELAPRDDYVGDPAVADRNGRQLGHAAAAAIEALPPPGTRFVYTGIVASGANLGTWEYRPCEPEQLAAAGRLDAVLTRRRPRAQGRHRRRREPLELDARLAAGAREGDAAGAPAPRARRRAGAPDADLGLAPRGGAPPRGPERALLRVPGGAAAALRRDAAPRPDDDERRRRLPAPTRDATAPAGTRSSSRRTHPGASSRRSRPRRRRSSRCARGRRASRPEARPARPPTSRRSRAARPAARRGARPSPRRSRRLARPPRRRSAGG